MWSASTIIIIIIFNFQKKKTFIWPTFSPLNSPSLCCKALQHYEVMPHFYSLPNAVSAALLSPRLTNTADLLRKQRRLVLT